jgi:hypothetical protein
MIKRGTVTVLALLLASSMAACGDAPRSGAPAAPSSGDLEAIESGSPTGLLAPAPAASESQTPSRQPRATPSPRERLVKWSTKPRKIFSGGCTAPVATVDGSSHFHVASICDGRLRYASSIDGRSWKTSSFAAPPDGFDFDLQLAVDGTTLYLAYTHIRPTDGDTCGGPTAGLIGIHTVHYRTRALPDGRWSAPARLAQAVEHVQSLRVVDGTMHVTFDNGNGGRVSYASIRGSSISETRLPEAESTALRVGDDGRPRIAFTAGGTVRLATLTGAGRFSTTTVFSADDVWVSSPVLVLGSGDHAYVSWSAIASANEAGCYEPPPPTHEGTWFATDADGKWATKRLSKDIGTATLAVDVETGRLHATYNDSRGIRYVTRAADGTWSGSRLKGFAGFAGSVLRRDPATGTLLLVGSSDDEAKPGIYAFTAS